MIISILTSLITICSFSLFTNGLKYTKINNAFLYMDKGIFETSLIYVDKDGNPVYPYFNKEALNTQVSDYFENSFGSLINDYTYSLIYLTEKETISLENETYKVKISLKAALGLIYSFQKARIYSIKEGEIHG